MNESVDSTLGQRKPVAIWLLICCALVFAMVVLGGVTRLTGSGLSMVDWRPLLGWLPPLNDAQWQATFELYQDSPQYRMVNLHMDVQAFKGIFWLEYLHRLLGRIIGIAFLLPFLWFLVRGAIGWRQAPRYAAMFVLGGLQGVLGWYMVKSGLVDDPRVSPYRLTAHLLLAFAIFSYLFWVALDLLAAERPRRRHPWFGRTLALGALIVLTISSGGFVAGIKAGTVYNTFPTMGGHWLPPGLWALEPGWRNLFENLVTVQFNHRLLALLTAAAIGGYWLAAVRGGLSGALLRRVHLLAAAAMTQVALGIATLLTGVPTALASAHQATAMIVLAAAVFLVHGLARGGARQGLADGLGMAPDGAEA